MAEIRFERYPHGGIKTTVNGVEIPEVRDIVLRFVPDDVATLTLDCNLTEETLETVNALAIKDATVHVHLKDPGDGS